jgi:alcohol dehydrogenase
MLAAVLRGVHDVGLEERPRPTLQDDTDVLIRVTATMICSSEVHYAEGFLPPCPPFIMGHEFVGVIEEVGAAVTSFTVGDRVVAPPYPFCGKCEICRKGVSGMCPSGRLFGSGESFGNMAGGLAEYVRAPLADAALLKIPDEISDEQAVFVPDMLATGYFGVQNAQLQPGQTLAIIGAGPVGLCAAAIARLYDLSQVIVIGRRTNRLDAAIKMGATNVVDTAAADPVEEVTRLTEGRGADAVIDAVASAESIASAVPLLAIGGTLSVIGFPPPGNVGLPLQALTFKNPTLRFGVTDQSNMPFLLDLLRTGKVDVSPLLTHVRPFTEFESAFEMFAGKHDNCLKVLLKP